MDGEDHESVSLTESDLLREVEPELLGMIWLKTIDSTIGEHSPLIFL